MQRNATRKCVRLEAILGRADAQNMERGARASDAVRHVTAVISAHAISSAFSHEELPTDKFQFAVDCDARVSRFE